MGEGVRRGGGGGIDIAEASYFTVPRVLGSRAASTVYGVAFKRAVRRFTTSVDELDRERLIAFCDECDLTPMTALVPRTQVRVGGEVRSVRVVPRAGAPALEVTISDGRGAATAVFLGRRKISGVVPGRHITVEGVVGRSRNRFLLLNPLYTLYP
jgi:hypothetical protein